MLKSRWLKLAKVSNQNKQAFSLDPVVRESQDILLKFSDDSCFCLCWKCEHFFTLIGQRGLSIQCIVCMRSGWDMDKCNRVTVLSNLSAIVQALSRPVSIGDETLSVHLVCPCCACWLSWTMTLLWGARQWSFLISGLCVSMPMALA